ncbi:MAG: acyltransferase [Draconibacterium sp.]|nr:acyltransferase [Draconibacterium sp.]
MMKILFQLLIIWLPWSIRRKLLSMFYGYKIHPTARIGKSLIFPVKLEMAAHSRIHNLVICKQIDRLVLNEDSGIATMTFITGFKTGGNNYFKHVENRQCELILGKSAGITSRHFIDCNGGVYIGDFTTVAGIRSQILTHSIDIYKNRQHTSPIHIGKYCFLGTGCILLPGTKLPDYSILGAGSVLTKEFEQTGMLYGGNPSKPIKKLEVNDTLYFQREKHVVD